MEEQFVPYELAVKLKELGFDEPTLAGYRDYNGIKLMTRVKDNTFPLVNNYGFGKYCHQNKHIIKAPLWQQVFDWFVYKHDLYSWINPSFKCFNVNIVKYDKQIDNNINMADGLEWKDFVEYEEARQASLEKLIELITK